MMEWLRFDPSPLVVVDGDLNLEWRNDAALAWLIPGCPVVVNEVAITLADADVEARFKAFLVEAPDSGWRAFIASVGADISPLVIFARRIPGTDLFGVAFRFPANVVGVQLDHIASHYGLTPAEQDVLKHYVSGRSVSEIAAETGKALLTVRTHIKHCYSKCAVTSKEQLFGLLMRLTF